MIAKKWLMTFLHNKSTINWSNILIVVYNVRRVNSFAAIKKKAKTLSDFFMRINLFISLWT